MGMTDNFGHPKGILGRLMLSGMNLGHTPMAKWGFSQLEIPEGARIVDIGCGGGANIRRFLKACPTGRVYGVDISEESVRKSRKVNKKALGTRCRIVQGSVEKLPFRSGVLDLATAFETIYFWPDPVENFKEIRRVLKPGGRFAVICDAGDPDSHWEDMIPGMKVYSPEQIEEYMKGAGFTDIRTSRKLNMFCVNGKAS